MTTNLRDEFEAFIQAEMPDLLADDKKKELQECWIAYLRGHVLRLDMEIKRGEQLLLEHQSIAKKIGVALNIMSILLMLAMALVLIWDGYK